jgi:hypothetical protein
MSAKDISSTQKGSSKGLTANQASLTEPSLWEADGHHFTVEGKSLIHPAAQWERIERSWENPNVFTAQLPAEAVARTLALRYDGERAYRVVDPHGKALQVFWVRKMLSVLEEGQGEERFEDVPAGFDVPMLFEVLEERKHQKRVFLSSLHLPALFGGKDQK